MSEPIIPLSYIKKLEAACNAALRFYGSQEAFGDNATLSRCAYIFGRDVEPLIRQALNQSPISDKRGEG